MARSSEEKPHGEVRELELDRGDEDDANIEGSCGVI